MMYLEMCSIIGRWWFKKMTKLINTIYETGEWPKDFTEVTMTALKKKPQATKCSDHHTISLITHTAKIVAKILRRRIEMKIEDVLGEDLDLEEEKELGMLGIISERTLEIDEELCVCFIDWQKAFDWVNWTKLTLILWRSRTGTVWFYTSTSNKWAARPKLYTRVINKGLKAYV